MRLEEIIKLTKLVTKNYILVMLLFILFACTKDNREIKYNSSGDLDYVLYTRGNDTVKYIKINKEGALIYLNREKYLENDTVKEYYPNGNLMFYMVKLSDDLEYTRGFNSDKTLLNEGYIYKGKQDGWWNFYKKNKLFKTNYFVKIDGEIVSSQIQYFNSNGIIDINNSNFIEINIPDTLYTGRSTGKIIYKQHKDYNEERVIIGYNLNPDYSNISGTRIDTFYNSMSDGFFGVEFEKLGRNKIRGILDTRKISDTNKRNDSLFTATISIKNRYFEKEFFVIPRPDSIPKDKVIRYDNLN